MDFPCPLLWTDPGAEPLSLAEVLENAEAVFEVWHQTSATKPGSFFIYLFIHSFIQTISIAPLQVHFYSEALLT